LRECGFDSRPGYYFLNRYSIVQPENLFHKIGSEIPSSTVGNLFGKPCYKIEGKAFICFFEEELVCKLKPSDVEQALSLEGAQLFDPSKKDRPMKAWVQIPFPHKKSWSKFTGMAKDFVQGLIK